MTPVPPRAPRRPTVLRAHGDERIDDWYWLRERDDPDVRAYLEAENEYRRAATAHLTELQGRLFDEIVGRVQQTDVSAPARRGAWEYFSRTREGRQYPVYCRRPAGRSELPDAFAPPGEPAGEVVLLDGNTAAAGHEYFAIGGFAVSPEQRLLAYSTDTTGGERFELRFRDLDDGRDVGEVISDVYYGLGWANDDRTVFYTRPDVAMRPYQVWRHVLGTDPSRDALLLQEDDERFAVAIRRTRTGRFVIISSQSKLTSEVHVLDADDPPAPARLVAERTAGIEYHIEHHASREAGDRFFVITNDAGAENFKLMVVSADHPERANWEEVIPHRTDVRLLDVDAFAGHVAVSERAEGLQRLVVHAVDGRERHAIEMPDPVYASWMGPNLEFETSVIRFEYTSLVTPASSYDYDVSSRERRLIKRQPVLGGYEPSKYETERVWATAPDGVHVPISVVHRRGLPRDGTAPTVLYGYGAYEVSIDPAFSSTRLSLLDRGTVFAIAHVRGGGELGRRWYEDGKLERKPNTFHDFIACAEQLVRDGYTSPDRLAARGASAGGLLMGAATNLRPDLFRAVVAEVPFVDCLTTMLDESLPLTVTEWEEWGNPVADAEIYKLMKSYSPYDNLEEKDYPALLATGGINDPRVQYWEPAKWVAKLRAMKTDDRLLLLKMEMGAGHAGRSGRYDAWRDEAFVLAFLLDQLGLG